MDNTKYRKFKVSYYKGFKMVSTAQMVSGSDKGMTKKEALEYCRDKFPQLRVNVEV